MESSNFTLEDESSREAQDWGWFCPRAMAWSSVLFSYVISALSSLMTSMSIAFSPLTVSALVQNDCSYLEMVSSPTYFISSDHLVNRLAASDADEKVRNRIDNNSFETTKNDDKESGTFSLDSSAARTRATLPVITPRILTNEMAFQRAPVSVVSPTDTPVTTPTNHQITYLATLSEFDDEKRKEVPIVIASEAFTNRNNSGSKKDEGHPSGEEEEIRPRKKMRLESPAKENPRMAIPQPKDKSDVDWETMFRSILKYKQKHGSTTVPLSYKDRRLACWVNRQRCKLRRNELTPAQADLLGSIGFVCDTRVEWKEETTIHWMQMYQKLLSYREKHNCSTNVPCKNEHRRLGYWVKKQRRKLRTNKLSKQRTDLLVSIGFV